MTFWKLIVSETFMIHFFIYSQALTWFLHSWQCQKLPLQSAVRSQLQGFVQCLYNVRTSCNLGKRWVCVEVYVHQHAASDGSCPINGELTLWETVVFYFSPELNCYRNCYSKRCMAIHQSYSPPAHAFLRNQSEFAMSRGAPVRSATVSFLYINVLDKFNNFLIFYFIFFSCSMLERFLHFLPFFPFFFFSLILK